MRKYILRPLSYLGICILVIILIIPFCLFFGWMFKDLENDYSRFNDEEFY